MTDSPDEDRHTDEHDALLAAYNGLIESLDVMPADSEWRTGFEQLRDRIAPLVDNEEG